MGQKFEIEYVDKGTGFKSSMVMQAASIHKVLAFVRDNARCVEKQHDLPEGAVEATRIRPWVDGSSIQSEAAWMSLTDPKMVASIERQESVQAAVIAKANEARDKVRQPDEAVAAQPDGPQTRQCVKCNTWFIVGQIMGEDDRGNPMTAGPGDSQYGCFFCREAEERIREQNEEPEVPLAEKVPATRKTTVARKKPVKA